MRLRVALLAAVLISAGISLEANARTEPFGQETADLRTPRFAKRQPQQHRHTHGNHRHDQGQGAHNHNHADGHVHDQRGRHGNDRHFGHRHGLETENLFGFVLGADTEHKGARAVAVEIVGRFNKRDGRYAAYGKKLEFAYGLTDDISAGFGFFAIHQRVRGVTGFDDVSAFDFNGIGGELRWRLLRREQAGFGMTLHFEPSIQRHDELTGLRGVKYGAENKLIFDTELVKDTWFAAFNVLYEFERVRETGETEWERGSKFGLGFAVTRQLFHHVFLGAEMRYLRAYQGLTMKEFTGEALYLGPTLFAKIGGNGWVSLSWNRQIWGEEADNPDRLDLVNFERDQVRFKAGIEF